MYNLEMTIIAEAIEEYENTRANPGNAGGSGPTNIGGIVASNVKGCSYKTFINYRPHPFNGTKGVVRLKCWFERMEQVFEISKCAEDDKVNVKTMMTIEYYTTIEIQRMEQELWTLTLKGDNINDYNNRFDKLALMCPDLVTLENKKIKRQIRGLLEIVKENVTYSKHTTLHDAINMAHELVKQAVQGRAASIALVNGRGYAGNLPWNKCPKGKNQQNEGARARAYVIGTKNPQQNPNVITDIAPAALGTSYEVELADGKVVSTNTILCGCTLALFNHVFKIDLLLTRLVRILLSNGEILEIQGGRLEKDLKLFSCIKIDEKKPKYIRVVHDFPEVFPDNLSGLPPVREIEFRIDLIPGALLVIKFPYQLAPSKMLELSNQLKEL
nr:hypothetical protein [Tanacetum cinerariifolium]